MESVVKYLTVVLMMGIINRYRGTSYPLPVRNVFWVWVAIQLLLTSLGMDPWVALTWALGWMLWCIPGWMRVVSEFLSLNNAAYGQGRPLTWDEKIVEKISGGHPVLAIYTRTYLWLIPLAVALVLQHQVAWPLLLVGSLFPLCYYAGLEWTSDGDISKVAEFLVGLTWGTAIVFSWMLTK